MKGESYLRADYSISCDTSLNLFFKFYAALMILVSRPAIIRDSRRGHTVSSSIS